MITVAWVNFTSTDKRGPQKKFVEYVVEFSKTCKEQMKVIALFPFDSQDTKIYETFDANQITYYECPVTRYSWLGSPIEERRRVAYQQFTANVTHMKRILQEINCDIVVSNCSLVWEAAYAAKALGIKHVIFFRGILNPSYLPQNVFELPVMRKIEKKLLDLTSVGVSQSIYTGKLWELDKRDMRWEIIPVGCQIKGEWKPPTYEEEVLKVLVLSGLENYKNQTLILDVAYGLKQKGKKVEFNIYGDHKDDAYRSYIEHEMNRLGLQEMIHIREYDPQIDKLYQEHPVLFVCSTMETFGVTVCEAMGRCRAVVSTRSGGPEETILNGETGFLADATDIEGLVSCFCRLAEDKALITQMGIAGRKRWEDNYALPVVAKSWEKLLIEEVAKSEPKKEQDITGLMEQFQEDLDLGIIKKVVNQVSKNWLIISKNIYSAGVHIGLENGLACLQNKGVLNYHIVDDKQAQRWLEWADVVVFARAVDQSMRKLLDEAKSMNKQTLYYVDDSLYDIPIGVKNGANYNTSEAQESLEYFLQQTEALVTCSQWLAKSYEEKFQMQAVWINPAVKPSLIKGIEKQGGPIIIGFAGNVDYLMLLESLKPLFIKLYEKYGEQIQFEFCGPRVSYLDEIKGVHYKPLAYDVYETLMARRRWDIGIAYTEDTVFANKKFYNKYLEYGRLGVAGVYSNTELFRRIIREGENGLLAESDWQSWLIQIEKLINDTALRKSIVQRAHEEVMNRFSLEQGALEIQTKLAKFL